MSAELLPAQEAPQEGSREIVLTFSSDQERDWYLYRAAHPEIDGLPQVEVGYILRYFQLRHELKNCLTAEQSLLAKENLRIFYNEYDQAATEEVVSRLTPHMREVTNLFS